MTIYNHTDIPTLFLVALMEWIEKVRLPLPTKDADMGNEPVSIVEFFDESSRGNYMPVIHETCGIDIVRPKSKRHRHLRVYLEPPQADVSTPNTPEKWLPVIVKIAGYLRWDLFPIPTTTLLREYRHPIVLEFCKHADELLAQWNAGE